MTDLAILTSSLDQALARIAELEKALQGLLLGWGETMENILYADLPDSATVKST